MLSKRVPTRLARRFGKDFSLPDLRNKRQFFLAFPEGSAVPEEFGAPRKRPALPGAPSGAEIR